MTSTREWTIVGGGPHGALLAIVLLTRGGVDRDQLAIVDPAPRLLDTWFRTTHACGMSHLRSPGAHGLEPDFSSLPRWAASNGFTWSTETIPPYSRPSIALFNGYARAMVERYALEDLHVRASVERLTREERWSLCTSPGDTIASRRVILALGAAGPLRRPEWSEQTARAATVPGHPKTIRHVYEPGFEKSDLAAAETPVVIGGGVAAAQLAVWLAQNRHETARAGDVPRGPVVLLARHPLQVSQFDSDPCFGGPRCLADFLALPAPSERRLLLSEVRRPGTLPPDVHEQVSTWISRGNLEVVVDEVARADRTEKGIRLVTRGGCKLVSDGVALATGHEVDPGGGLVSTIAADARDRGVELRIDEAGFPVPGEDLRWDEDLYVTGWLGEQELGPSAPNIIGAHNAAKRIISSLNGEPRPVPVAWKHYGV